MKHGLSVSVLLACAAAGVLSALAFASGGPSLGGATTTTAPPTPTIRPPHPTIGAPARGPTAAVAQALPEGVTVGGVPVGNLLPADASKQIRAYFTTPLKLRVGKRLYAVDPSLLATPKIAKALERARVAQPFANLGLAVVIKSPRLRTYVASLAKKVEVPPVDARLLFRNLTPSLTPERRGLALAQADAVNAIARALRLNSRERLTLGMQKTRAEITRKNFGPSIVIRRGSNRLYLYAGMRLNRIFPVATGQTVYPTPLGSFDIVVKWRNPWWYPPNSPWAQGEKPIPPGPNNPLGTRWMGLSAPGVGIHGTNNDASIGYSVSHGCIRMHVPDAEGLFNHVDIGTPVFIVSA